MRVHESKIVVSDVSYGNGSIQELGQQLLELLLADRYTFQTQNQGEHVAQTRTQSVSGGQS